MRIIGAQEGGGVKLSTKGSFYKPTPPPTAFSESKIFFCIRFCVEYFIERFRLNHYFHFFIRFSRLCFVFYSTKRRIFLIICKGLFMVSEVKNTELDPYIGPTYLNFRLNKLITCSIISCSTSCILELYHLGIE